MWRDLLVFDRRYSRSSLPLVVAAHPCMFATHLFYDLHNQRRRGVFPPKDRWRPAPVLPGREIRRRLALLDAFAGLLAERKDVEFVTLREVVAEHTEDTPWLTRAQVVRLAARVTEGFNYQRVGRGFLSAADIFGVLNLAVRRWVEEGALTGRVPVRRLIGPPEPAPVLRRAGRLSVEQVIAGARDVEREADVRHRLPSVVRIGRRRVPPASFLAALAEAVHVLDEGVNRPVTVPVRPAFPRVRDELFGEVKVGSSELPSPFDPGTIVTYTWQQTWTFRPAVAGRREQGDGPD